jgi:hypothetical protein
MVATSHAVETSLTGVHVHCSAEALKVVALMAIGLVWAHPL